MIRQFIKWAGGKTRVLPDLLPHLPKADCLIEPFVGGASVFLATEYRRYVLADINQDLINLYREVTRYPDLVIDAARELFNSKNSPQGYNEVRAAFNKQVGTVKSGGLRYGAEMACIMRAAQFLYLNRHGYNGLCRYSRKTGFNVPSEDGKQCFSAGFKPTKGKKFVVLLLGEVDKTAIDYDLEAALNRLGFYRKEDNR